MLDQQQIAYFKELSQDRAKKAEALESFALSGVRKSVIEKYSDQAHFIYELLQNADDAGATTVRFELFDDKLIFAHNGKRRFSLSDPLSEKEDQEKGKLGDINAISAVGGSAKNDKSTIGKFGVGFKAVFKYTSTPCIYDPNVFFKIERFIVPVLLDDDYIGRSPDETLFVFPFNHEKCTPEAAFNDISEKLKSLEYPLLFLTNLANISFKISNDMGCYGKSIEKTYSYDVTTAEFIKLTRSLEENQTKQEDRLWMFSRQEENGFRYYVGFFVDEKGNLMPKSTNAFCFFPTKEATGLNFIIHAPFLLTDSRESILAGEEYNINLISKLSELAADSLEYIKDIGITMGTRLINDDIFDIIPYDEDKFGEINSKNKISFKPFFSEMFNAFKTREIIPASDGYVSSNNAYWASVPQIAELFSNEQLAALIENPSAKWVFITFGRQNTHYKNRALTNYIDSLTKLWLDEEDILDHIDHEKDFLMQDLEDKEVPFIEMQPIEWLHRLYHWIGETKSRIELARTKHIFINQDRKAVAAFDENDQAILFLPTDEENEYNTVHKDLLLNEDTVIFLSRFGLKEPDPKDEIYNIILPKYNSSILPDANESLLHFKKIFSYYLQCSRGEEYKFISLIKNYQFIRFYSGGENKERGLEMANSLYIPSLDLQQWFDSKADTKFIDLECYVKLLGQDSEESLRDFFIALGAKNAPCIAVYKLSWTEAHEIKSHWEHENNIHYASWNETFIDGCEQIVKSAIESHSLTKSELIWKWLLKLIESGQLKAVHNSRIGTLYLRYDFFYYSRQRKYYDLSRDTTLLRTKPWLLNSDGEFVSADKLTIQTLHQQYDRSCDEALELFDLLGIKDESENSKPDISALALKLGLSEEEQRQALLDFANKKTPTESKQSDDSTNDDWTEEDVNEKAFSSVKREAKGLLKRVSSSQNSQSQENNVFTDDSYIDIESDEDDFTKNVNLNRKIEKIQSRMESDIQRIAQLEDLKSQAIAATKYSFGWFKALLELETLSSREDRSDSREISISFGKVERESHTSRTIMLMQPNRYIPQSMEDLADIPLELYFADKPPVKLAIEVVSIKSYTLRVKLRPNVEIDNVNFSCVTEAHIEAQNPVFLMKELKNSFVRLGEVNQYNDDFNMRDNLSENIEFVFGPPGTGKTTFLATNYILPAMKAPENLKVLVLTPTNKSADVLTQRIIEAMNGNLEYQQWLVRFGSTDNGVVEKSGVFRDKVFDIRKFQRNVTITTIARFSYDYFLPEASTRLHLKELKWDYIIIDEASMIPLATIIYPLYKKTPRKFIIAGDPFQIEPITTVDLWKGENIYSMVELNSFSSPTTVPHKYHVELLTTQYRSIPCIGEVFSKFAYDGVLKHFRTEECRIPLPHNPSLNFKPLNIIKFPVKKFESIYRAKRLQEKTPYQVYSALFAFEFIKHISSVLSTNSDSEYHIGLIAPYHAQANLIDKLMSSMDLPKGISVQVGTIHGFQGDECDIIIALFNPPPKITTNENMFLNKLNIINVAISRARDYLFVLMPDDDTENVDDLTLVKRVEQLCKEQPNWIEYSSAELEDAIFGSSTYIEENSFITSHQLVNVYGNPENRYEVRSENNAIDIQVHEQTI